MHQLLTVYMLSIYKRLIQLLYPLNAFKRHERAADQIVGVHVIVFISQHER